MLLLGLLFAQVKSHWPVRCVVNYPSCCLVSRFLQIASCCGVALTCSGCCCDPLVFPTLIMGVEYLIKVCVLPGDQVVREDQVAAVQASHREGGVGGVQVDADALLVTPVDQNSWHTLVA